MQRLVYVNGTIVAGLVPFTDDWGPRCVCGLAVALPRF